MSYAEKVAATRPDWPPLPDRFRPVATFNDAGIRVLKSEGREIAAIQFAEDRKPDRAEKDALEAVYEAEPDKHKFIYNTDTRAWERRSGGNPGGNVVDAVRFATALAEGRNAGQGVPF